jgi:CHAT domain-containing protein
MQTLYRLRESQPGLPKVEALRQAQLVLLRGPGGEVPGPQVEALLVASMSATAETRQPPKVVPEPQARDTCNVGTVSPRFRPSPQAPYAHPFYWAPFILIGNWL